MAFKIDNCVTENLYPTPPTRVPSAKARTAHATPPKIPFVTQTTQLHALYIIQ